jgi:hypothetical protein
MRDVLMCILAGVGFVVSHFFSPEIAHAAIITVINLDGAGEGFNDPSAPDSASTTGGNNGATLGAQRLIAFQRAANIWGNRLSSPVEIRISASLNPLACSDTSAVLGAAGTTSVFRNFIGAPLADTWYPQALANSLAGTDLDPANSDIQANFNSALGTPSCSFPLVWYYGLTGNPPGGTLDFVSVVLHELGHGLGFQSFVTLSTGAKLLGFDDTFSRNLEDHSTGKVYPQMTDQERVAASQNSGNLRWIGPNVVAASGTLTAGVDPTGHVQMYAPNPQQPGSSVSHFDTAVTPNELMEPFYTGANHGVSLTSELFVDLGWRTLSSFADVDFDGDGKADIGIYRDGVWSISRSSDGGNTVVGLGSASHIPVPADYDGDGKTDEAVYSNGVWTIIRSSDGGTTVVGWGGPGYIPVPADYDGDGKADIAVYRDGVWSILRSSDGGNTLVGWGGPAFTPVPADYDGDGKADIVVYSNGVWSIVRSSDGGNTVVGWGGPSFIPVLGDYDGDGKADIAVYHPSGVWSIKRSSDSGNTVVGWGGAAQDMPVPADYDGDGKTDIGIYRDGAWSIKRSSDGGNTLVGWGGAPQDIPLSGQ